MKIDVSSRGERSRVRKGALALTLLAGVAITPIALVLGSSPAGAASTTYTPTTPTLSTLTSPAGCSGSNCSPWNEYQGDTSAAAYSSNGVGTVLPTYTPGGVTTSTANGAGGATVTEPNLSVVPSAGSTTVGVAPYPSGVVGTPGPLDDYCGSGTQTTESSQPVSRQAGGTTLPFAPSYFPHVVRNADGTLTGYFDYRPKDADEALMAATSTDNGKDWTYDGEAIEQNPDYCPSVDVNDDGQGHANVITVGGKTFLYTLPRAAGDNAGVGMVIHQFSPTESNPLNGLPADESVGVDPDAFVTGSSRIPIAASGGVPIAVPVTTTGTAGSPEQLLTGSFIDLTQDATQTPANVINCTVTLGVNSLSSCTMNSTSTMTVDPGDLIEQVIGWTTEGADPGLVIPSGPNNTLGTGGQASIAVDPTQASGTNFLNPATANLLATNAPNRLYIDGTAIYCGATDSNPTQHLQDCTTGPNNASYTIPAVFSPITTDPIVPASSYDAAAGDGMTNGLVAPDGIVGVLPNYPGAPSGATTVMYTQKELGYYIAGTTTAGSTAFSSASTINFFTGEYTAEDLPSNVSSSAPVTVYIGDNTLAGDTPPVDLAVPVTCTGLSAGTADMSQPTDNLTGCTVPSSISGFSGYKNTDKMSSNSYIGAPGAATTSGFTLAQTGEGSTTSAKHLFKNNEDLSVLRVAYTTDGVNFSTNGLTNGGVISDCTTSSGIPEVSGCTSPYTGVNNPSTNVSPSNLNEYATNEGTPGGSNGTDIGSVSGGDAEEMRWVGSAGSIIINPDGSYGMFLSGAWANDGDSDAFNQIFYSSSTDGVSWATPTPVISTDYSFSASYNQDNNINGYGSQPIGVSAYYEGRAYGASVVQNPNGTLTMVFAGYRFPKSIVSAGSVLGTGSNQWTVGANDLTMYRNILTTTLSESTTPAVSTTTTMTTPPSSPAVVGQTESVSATVAPVSPGSGTPTGTVTFSGGAGTLCTGTLNESTPDTTSCTYTYDGPLSSPDSVTASYVNDANYASSASTATPVTVSPDATTTSTPSASNGGSPANPAVVGEPVTLSSTVTVNAPGSGTPTGSVSFSDGGATPLCTGTLSGGSDTATCTYTPATTNTGDSITANYGGDTNDTSSTSSSLTEVVDAAPTTTTLTISPTTPLVGQSVTLSATVTANAPGGGSPTGTVTFDGNGGSLCAATLSGDPATASCTTMYAGVTSDSITANYPGDGNYVLSSASSTLSVGQATTSTAVAPDDSTPVVGEQVTYTATVSVTPPGSGAPTGTVSFTGTNSGPVCTDVPVSNSETATCTHAYTSTGSDSVSAAYSGDSNFASSGSSTSVVIGQDATTTTVSASPSPAVVGQAVTLTGVVAPVSPGAATPSGSVSFSDAGGTCTGTLSGMAPYTASCTTTYSSPVSDDTVTGTYGGDANDAGSPGTTTETVNQDATNTVVAFSPTSPVVGQQVTYTASVSVAAPGAGTPTGSVVFSGDGDTTYCTSALSGANPAATCTKTYAGAGGDTVTAAYGGDTNDLTSTGTETPTIGQDATTTSAVFASPSSPVVGQAVTLEATVAVTAPGAGTPSGTVSFSGDGASCTGNLSESSPDTASCTTTFPGATSGTVTATYGGDTNDVGSSGTTTVSVRKAGTMTTVTSSPSSPVAGQTISLSATVAAQAPGAGVPTGTVTFTSGGTLCSATLDGSSPDTASCSATFNGGTSGTVTGTYGGDTNFTGSNGSTSLSIGKGSTTTTVSSSTNPAVTGQPLTFTATVGVVAPATGTPSGSVTFAFSDPAPTKGPGHLATPTCGGGGTTADSVTLNGGTATCSISGLLVEQSPLKVTATYSGSPSFGSSASPTLSQTVGTSPSQVTVAAKLNPTITAKAASFSATVAAASPGAGDPTGTATWTITGASGAAVPCKSSNTTVNKTTGKSTCSVGTGALFAASGPYTVSVAYSGDANFGASTGTFTQDIDQTGSKTKVTVSPPAASGSPATVTAAVTGTPASAGTPTGTVTFALTSATGSVVDCDTSNTSTLSSGVATCTVTSALVLSGSPYSVVATYSGDGNFTTSASAPKAIKVPK